MKGWAPSPLIQANLELDDPAKHEQEHGLEADDEGEEGAGSGVEVADDEGAGSSVEVADDEGASRDGCRDGSDKESSERGCDDGEEPCDSAACESPFGERDASDGSESENDFKDDQGEPSPPHSVDSSPGKPPCTWNEDLFTTPVYGNSGFNRSELHEMCIGILEFFNAHHPDIARILASVLQCFKYTTLSLVHSSCYFPTYCMFVRVRG